jgi:hypothetical protein
MNNMNDYEYLENAISKIDDIFKISDNIDGNKYYEYNDYILKFVKEMFYKYNSFSFILDNTNINETIKDIELMCKVVKLQYIYPDSVKYLTDCLTYINNHKNEPHLINIKKITGIFDVYYSRQFTFYDKFRKFIKNKTI